MNTSTEKDVCYNGIKSGSHLMINNKHNQEDTIMSKEEDILQFEFLELLHLYSNFKTQNENLSDLQQ